MGVTIAHNNQTATADYFNNSVRLNRIATTIQSKQVRKCGQRSTLGAFVVIFSVF
jgi:hypothetical protein